MARTRSLATRERDQKALALRRRGLNLQQICDELGFKATSSASESIRRGLKDCYLEPREDAIVLELARLDDALRVEYRIMMGRHVAVSSSGRVVTTVGADGKQVPVYDDALNHQAAMGLKALSESRRKLLGLDAPTRIRHTVITDTEVDEAIRALEAKHAAFAAGEAVPVEPDRRSLA